jgi:hypothetical protein
LEFPGDFLIDFFYTILAFSVPFDKLSKGSRKTKKNTSPFVCAQDKLQPSPSFRFTLKCPTQYRHETCGSHFSWMATAPYQRLSRTDNVLF